MNIRDATTDDRGAIREIAQRSMEASYSLSPRTIESAVKQWYDQETLEAALEADDVAFVVAENEGEIVGYAEGVFEADTETGDGDVLWVHVDPAARGGNVGTNLFERIRDDLHDLGAERLRGLVLEDNREGSDFYERFDFEKSEERTAMIDGEPHVEFVYVEGGTEAVSESVGEAVSVPETAETDDGTEVFLDTGNTDMGSKGPFVVVYSDPAFADRYGYYCGNCGTLDTAMDAMGRVQCNDCGNLRKPTRWDAAYL